MTDITDDESNACYALMDSLKPAFGLSQSQSLFNLSKSGQIEFQKEMQRLSNPDQKVFRAWVKTTHADGSATLNRHTVEI